MTRTGFDAVVVVDWSAASTRGPRRPTRDRVWFAWALTDRKPSRRPPPRYCRTRSECLSALTELLDTKLAGAATLVGFDFPIGYPPSDTGKPVLPAGRELCAHIAGLIEDHPDATNNRFDVAAELNRSISTQTLHPQGPFWGHPPGRSIESVSFTKPTRTGVREWRICEQRLKALGTHPQSAWKLSGIGSVGSQSLLGLPTVHALLTHLSGRGALWPFDPAPTCENAVTIAEVWPTLAGDAVERVDHTIKDARQVVALRDHLLLGVDLETPEIARTEGWILGSPSSTSTSPDASARDNTDHAHPATHRRTQ